jgi:hypothetical protein
MTTYVVSFRHRMSGKFEVEAENFAEAEKKGEVIVKSSLFLNHVKKSGCHLIYRYKKERKGKRRVV